MARWSMPGSSRLRMSDRPGSTKARAASSVHAAGLSGNSPARLHPRGLAELPDLRLHSARLPAAGQNDGDAYRYTQKLRMYYLSEANNPPQQRFIDPINDRYATLPFYDERRFSGPARHHERRACQPSG